MELDLDKKLEDDESIIDKKYEYYEKLINTFMIYYNTTFNKHENLFTGVDDVNTKINDQMVLLHEAIYEFDETSNKLNMDKEQLLDKIYIKGEYVQIEGMGMYCLEFGDNIKMYSSLLLNCLNYVIIHDIKEWNIYNLSIER